MMPADITGNKSGDKNETGADISGESFVSCGCGAKTEKISAVPTSAVDIEKFPEIVKLRNRQKTARLGRVFLGILALRPMIVRALTDDGFSGYLLGFDYTAEDIIDTLMPLGFLVCWIVFKNYRIGYMAAFAVFVSVMLRLYENPWMLQIHPIISGSFLCIAVVAYGAHSQGTVERMKAVFKGLV